MEVKRLTLKNFRNYGEETVELAPRTNLIYGDNAQGKTNLLEAVHLAATGRSHRAKTDSQMVRFGEEYARVSVEFADRHRDYKIVIGILPANRKSVKINDVPINKLSVLVNYLNVVMFSPEDLELVKGSPKMRRQFMDTSISSLSPRYMSELVSYHKVLAQKNNLLKKAKFGDKKAADNIDVWNIQLASAGARIMKERKSFIDGIKKWAKDVHREIAESELEIVYSPSFEIELLDTPNPELSFLQRLEEVKQREIEYGSALYGIQRDEIRFFIDGNEAKLFASQGQQRTIVLCMKLALTEYIKTRRDEYPVLLFDDIMSELDEKHRSYLADKIRDKQVLLTCTDREESRAARVIKVTDGKTVKEE
ncbi:MAG: DNA replication/repair protein RecF [Clostridia bacterium]|nr:DNA replication/repair protein RecF [Clostridia bacterium]